MTCSSPFERHSRQATCSKCYSRLEQRDSVLIKNKREKYHTKCLKCCECNEEINYDYYNHNGQPLCLNCKLINAKSCTICSQKIFGDSYTFDKKNYHYNCFRCSQCMKLMKGRKLLVDKNGDPCCSECMHTHKTVEKPCAKCQKPLSDTKSFCKSFDDSYYHTDCMKCNDCKIQISSTEKFFRSGEHCSALLCIDCGLRRIMNRLTKLFKINA